MHPRKVYPEFFITEIFSIEKFPNYGSYLLVLLKAPPPVCMKYTA